MRSSKRWFEGVAAGTLLLILPQCQAASPPPSASPAARPTAAADPKAPAASKGDAAASPEQSQRIELEEHGLFMMSPAGWKVQRGEGWVLLREPSGAAALMLYGVRDAGQGPEMLRLAEREMGATFPVTIGKLTAVPSGLRYAVTTEEGKLNDGTPARLMWIAGASPRLHGKVDGIPATGVFGFMRSDVSEGVRAATGAAIDSLAPM